MTADLPVPAEHATPATTAADGCNRQRPSSNNGFAGQRPLIDDDAYIYEMVGQYVGRSRQEGPRRNTGA